MNAILPCPHCGSTIAPSVTTDRQMWATIPELHPLQYTVCCDFHDTGCGATGGYGPTPERAIEKWNQRHA